MSGSIRCFVAVELPEELRDRIAADTAFLKKSTAGKNVKWVPPENLHLTIKFLGQVTEDHIPELTGLLKEAVSGIRPFEIEVAGAGVFPGHGSPRVFWVGIRDPQMLLAGLARNVEETLGKAGYGQQEKGGFSPHLTLGRLKEPRAMGSMSSFGRGGEGREEARRLADELATLKDALFGKINLENISLMRSELGPGGARYSRLAKIEFGGF